VQNAAQASRELHHRKSMPYLLYPEPGPVEETLNRLVHLPAIAPAADLLAGLASVLLYVAFLPLTVACLVARAGYRYARQALPGLFGGAPGSAHTAQEAIVVTGCDSGFGYAAALDLAQRGYTVFALCFAEQSSQQLEAAAKKHDNLVRVICDVTRDADVEAAAAAVDRWLSAPGSEPGAARRLLALVNNAGRGTPGLVDLLPLSEYEAVRLGAVTLAQHCARASARAR